jgi:hypothetical protein
MPICGKSIDELWTGIRMLCRNFTFLKIDKKR